MLAFTVSFCILLPLFANGAPIEDKNSKFSCQDLESEESQCSPFWANSTAPLILISVDGFRPEYLTRPMAESDNSHQPATPTLQKILNCGVHAPYMMPSFPTVTFPNHYTIVTGLYPESHGIVANSFFDPELNANFSIRYSNARDTVWWSAGEPIWTTVRRQGKVSATFFWPGSDVEDEDKKPSYYKRYNKSIPFEDRVDQVLRWMDLPPESRPVFTSLYFEEPDTTGHREGPESINVTKQITVVDSQIYRLLEGLRKRKILGCVNIVIVSDHGMAPSPPDQKLIDLEHFTPDLEDIARVYYGPLVGIYPYNQTENLLEEVTSIGESLECQSPHMRVYTKWDLPYRHHSSDNPRIPSVILDLDLGWRGMFRAESHQSRGNHGWDNLYPDMQAVFMGIGPSLKSQIKTGPFNNIEVYNLLCALTGVTPTDNNGTVGMLNHLLRNPPELENEVDQHSSHSILRFPEDGKSYKRNLMREKCPIMSHLEDVRASVFVNISEASTEEFINYHAPWNVPKTGVLENVNLLVTPDYVTGFDVSNGLPLWVQYTVENVSEARDFSAVLETLLDPRLDRHHKSICDRLSYPLEKDIKLVPLYHPAFSNQNVSFHLDTNLIELPVRSYEIWQRVQELLSEAVTERGPVNVVTGPTRSKYAGLFFVFTACKISETSPCPSEQIDVQSFILPVQSRFNEGCMSHEEFIALNVATLKDVEHLTKLEFFPNLPKQDKLKLLQKTTLESKILLNPRRHIEN